MGHESIVYGYIEGAPHHPELRLHRLNAAVIKRLPIEDEWPPLTRQMFCLPCGRPAQGTYRSQIIHFGGSFKSIEWEWEEWLEKFEALLQRLYWWSATVHLKTELSVGDHSYTWQANNDAISRLYSLPPQPITRWEFMGGPRGWAWDTKLPKPPAQVPLDSGHS